MVKNLLRGIHTCKVPGEDAQNHSGYCELEGADDGSRSPSGQGEFRHLEGVRRGM